MKKLIIVILAITISCQLSAQETNLPINVGYYSPYGINLGLKVGTSFQWKEWEKETSDKKQVLSISPQIGYWNYFVYGNTIHNTFSLETHLDYKKYFTQQFYGIAAVGLSYQMELQRENLSVDLGTTQVTPTTETVHNLVPMATFGLGKDNDRLGYYLKGFIGQRLATADGQNLFAGGEVGVIFYLKRG